MTSANESSVTLRDVLTLRQAGHLSALQTLQTFGLVRDRAAWNGWTHRLLLAFGVGHLLAAVIFFFAFNWQDIPPFAKFGFVQAAIIVAALSALAVRLDTVPGQALLIAASVLIGVLLAVIGQVYQTGADAYELFVGWTALALVFALASRSAAHWLVWLVIADVAVWLYGDQVLIGVAQLSNTDAYLLPALLTAAALAAREILAPRRFAWLGRRWTRITLIGLSGALLLLATTGRLFDFDGSEAAHAAMLVWVIAIMSFYRWRRFDAAGACLAAGIGALWLITTGIWALVEVLDFEGEVAILGLGAIWCVAVTAGLAKSIGWLRLPPEEQAS